MKPKNELTYICECGAEAFVVNILDFDDDSPPWIELSIHGSVPRKRPPLWWRIKEAWYVLRTGQRYTEMIMLQSPRALHELVDDLSYIANKLDPLD